ncbi:MAG: hypothetical protein ACT4PV_04960 [Planctomycetaceae bacterium]
MGRSLLVEPEGRTAAGAGIRADKTAPPSHAPATARPLGSEPTLEEPKGPPPPRRCTTCAEAFAALNEGGLTLDTILDCFWSAASASRDLQGRPLAHGLDRNARDREALRDELLVRCSQHLSLHCSLTSSRDGPVFQEAGQVPKPPAAPPPAQPVGTSEGTASVRFEQVDLVFHTQRLVDCAEILEQALDVNLSWRQRFDLLARYARQLLLSYKEKRAWSQASRDLREYLSVLEANTHEGSAESDTHVLFSHIAEVCFNAETVRAKAGSISRGRSESFPLTATP